MTDYAICPACGAALTSIVCNACTDSSVTVPGPSAATTGWRYNGFWQRFLIACIPAAVLALFVESTLYGYALYLGVYLTYCAWGEATSPMRETDDRRPSIQSHGQATANS
jgi:hypothetical protein